MDDRALELGKVQHARIILAPRVCLACHEATRGPAGHRLTISPPPGAPTQHWSASR